MKTFDEQLRAAFEAGEEHRQDINDIGRGYDVEECAPAFEEWRASLSGLNLVPHADLLTEVELERIERQAIDRDR